MLYPEITLIAAISENLYRTISKITFVVFLYKTNLVLKLGDFEKNASKSSKPSTEKLNLGTGSSPSTFCYNIFTIVISLCKYLVVQ